MRVAFLFPFLICSASAFAVVCPDETPHAIAVKERKNAISENIEGQIDTSTTVEDSPFLYENEDAGCDLGFSLPGLPDIGLGIGGIDSCSLLKAVTGDMVRDINKAMQDEVDNALIDAVGTTDLTYDVDLEDLAADAINEEVDAYREENDI